jgi:sterol desaturase/sphingolipid hydroxylase (fatty acid hydroxylase superfamily)
MRRWLPGVLVAVAFGSLVWLERCRALRPMTESKLRRDLRNLAVASAAGAVVALCESPVAQHLAARVERSGWGLVPALGLPDAAAVLLLDYSLYGWHVLTHRVPFLWRFHAPHHVDLDMDASTALRFHFGEILLSVPYRAAQVVLIGVRPGALAFWQTALFLSILFHHSNVRLPLGVERVLGWFIMSPRLHGIHHAACYEDLNSNWSSGLTIWDRLHGTLKTAPRQREITIGVPGYDRADQVTLPKVLAMPFRPGEFNPATPP